MSNWEIVPYSGLGPLRFGQTRANVRGKLRYDYSTFEKAPGVESETDAYDDLGVHLYYDATDRLEFIEAFSPCEVTYEGVRLLRSDLQFVLADLETLGLKHRFDDQGYFFDDGGFALFAADEAVEGVFVYRKGYYNE